MKDAEDEAFDEIARKQGAWGGGFKAKQAMAADKLQEPAQERCCYHDSDCAVHNMPAYPAGPCDCTQQFKFWSVTGKYERQAFACLSNAEAYCKGLNATYPEGDYIVSPLYTTSPQPAQEPHEYDWSMLEAAKESLREHMARIKELEAALAQPAQEPDALTIAYQSGFYDGKKAARARCIELVISGTGWPVQTQTLEALQSDRKRIAKLIEEDGK